MLTARERYQTDAHFQALVNMMVEHIKRHNYTPSEMREASILASIIYEEQNIYQFAIIDPTVENALRVIRGKIEDFEKEGKRY